MDTSAIGASNGAATTAAPRDRGLKSMKSEDFFRILVSELQQQDPFKPAETSDMINQVSQIRGIELSSQLNGTLEKFAQTQRATGASDLIGKYVYTMGATDNGEPVTNEGVVTGVHFSNDGAAALELDSGVSVPIDDVVRVTELDQSSAESKPFSLGDLFGAKAKDGAPHKHRAEKDAENDRWPLLSKLFG